MGLPRYDIWGRPRGRAGVYGSLYEQRSRAEGEKKGSLSSRGQNLWGPWATSSLSTGFSLGQQYVSVSIKLVFFFLIYCAHAWLFATPWTVTRQAPLSMGFSRQEYRSGWPIPFSRGSSKPRDPALQAESFPLHFLWKTFKIWISNSSLKIRGHRKLNPLPAGQKNCFEQRGRSCHQLLHPQS